MLVVNLDKLRSSKGLGQPIAAAAEAEDSERGLPQHRYAPLGQPAAAAQSGGSWWRRLWGRGTPRPAQQQQQLAESEWSPDYRGRLKAKHSGRNLELGAVLEEAEEGGSSSGGDNGLIGSSSGGRVRG